MKIGTVKEIKIGENRVGLTPYGVDLFVKNGHTVFVEKSAGVGSGFNDTDYRQAGATVLPSAKDVYAKARGQTRTKLNLVYACFAALKQLTAMKVQQTHVEKLGIAGGKHE